MESIKIKCKNKQESIEKLVNLANYIHYELSELIENLCSKDITITISKNYIKFLQSFSIQICLSEKWISLFAMADNEDYYFYLTMSLCRVNLEYQNIKIEFGENRYSPEFIMSIIKEHISNYLGVSID